MLDASRKVYWPLVVGLALLALSGQPVDAEDRALQNKTSIINSLAPVKYLPEHSSRKVSIDLDIRFQLGSAELSRSALAQLDELSVAMRSKELIRLTFEIAGHTDASGPADLNKRLSLERAASVKAYLVEVSGIAASRLEVAGFGEEQLKNLIIPSSGINRRVEIIARAKGGRAGPTKSRTRQITD
jgi:outer membrane protein OmpA-like peptidoglycan-associated protein